MTRVSKLLATLVALVVAILVAPSGAAAHPLGNFTVNRYAGIEIAGETVYLRYAVDLAEIPSFQLGREVRKPSYPVRLARDLELTIDGRRAPLRVLERRVVSTEGAAGLDTLRLDVVYVASGTGTALSFRDRSFGGRIGWREVTISARDGAEVATSDVPADSESRMLRAYPKELLRSPLDVAAAAATFTLGERSGSPPTIDSKAAVETHEEGGFEALIERGDLSTGVLLLSLLVAAFWGAAHALTPGTERRSSPRTSSVRGGGRVMPSCSEAQSPSRIPPAYSQSGS